METSIEEKWRFACPKKIVAQLRLEREAASVEPFVIDVAHEKSEAPHLRVAESRLPTTRMCTNEEQGYALG